MICRKCGEEVLATEDHINDCLKKYKIPLCIRCNIFYDSVEFEEVRVKTFKG